MSHTPGPWTVMSDDGGLYIYMEANAGKDESLAIYASENPDHRMADANLIAAAPDLLAAADQALDHLIVMGPQGRLRCEGTIDMLKAAIAKARGEFMTTATVDIPTCADCGRAVDAAGSVRFTADLLLEVVCERCHAILQALEELDGGGK